MTSKDFTEQGIAALKEGDKPRAHDLLRQATELDPTNAKAWYFLSRTQTLTAEKRMSLQKTLEIMPNNKPAREALDKLPPEDEDLDEFEDDESVLPTDIPSSTGAFGTGIKPQIRGIEIPVAIPDAPLTVEPQMILEEFIATFKNGVEILRRTPDSYSMEIQRATWWRFWQYVVVALIINGVVGTVANAISQMQLATFQNNSPFVTESVSSPNLILILISPIVFVPLSIFVLYLGLYASHRFITSNRGGRGAFVAHSYAIILPVVTVDLIANFSRLIFSLAPLLALLVMIALIILWIYSMYIAAQGITMVHQVDVTTGYWTIAVLMGVQIIASIIISPFLLTSGLGFI